MSDTPLNRSRKTLSDEEVIIDQEIRNPDGSVHRHREAVRQGDPALDFRAERAQLEVDRQLKIRDNDNAARGLLLGVIATTFLGLGILAWYLLTNRPETETAPVVVPAQPAEPSTPSSPPDINITLPNPPAATESTTETAPTQPTTIETQPALVQEAPPAPADPPSSTITAPATDPALPDPAPANSAAPNQPSTSSSTETEASTETTP